MAASRFYWYGWGSARLNTLDVYPSDLQAVQESLADGASTPGGLAVRVQYGVRWRVTIEVPQIPLADVDDYRQLLAHLRRGGAVGFALEPSKAILAFSDRQINAGQSILFTSGASQMAAWESGAALTAGDRLLIQSPNPESACEDRPFSSLSALGVLTLQSGVYGNLRQTPIAIRPYGFWPVLTLDPGDAAELTSDRELYYTLTLPLVEHPGHLAALRGVGLGATTTAHTSALLRSLEQAIGRAARGTTYAPMRSLVGRS
jgi:hypothetical protein